MTSWCKLMDGKIRSNFIHHFVSARFRRIIDRLESHIIPIKPFVSEDPDIWPRSNATFAYLAGAIHVFKNPQQRVAQIRRPRASFKATVDSTSIVRVRMTLYFGRV